MLESRLLGRLLSILISPTAWNTYLIFSGNILSAFLAFLFTVIMVRSLTFADIGYFSACWSFLLLISDLADIGIGSTLSAFLPPLEKSVDNLKNMIKTSFVLQNIVAASVTITLFLFAERLSILLFHRADLSKLMIYTITGIYFAIMANYFQYALSARQKFLQVASLSVSSSFFRLSFMCLLIVLSLLNLDYVVLIQTTSLFVLLVLAVFLFRLDFLSNKIVRSDFKKLILFSFPLGAARGLTALAGRLDVLMLIALTNPTAAGIYSTASRVISLYPLLSGSFSTVIAPKLSIINDKKVLVLFVRKVILATVVLVSTCLFMILISQPFMVTLFGVDKGLQAVEVFRFLLLAMVFFVASVPSVSVAIYFLRKPQILTVNSVVQLIVVVLGNIYLIPKYGHLGPAYSLIIAYGVSLFFTSYLTVHYFNKIRNK